jgi:hypothetical protein
LTAVSYFQEEALRSAVTHLVAQSRAFILQMEATKHEVGTLQDERAVGLIEALGQTLREPAGPGTLRHLERAATDLLRTLRTEGGE